MKKIIFLIVFLNIISCRRNLDPKVVKQVEYISQLSCIVPYSINNSSDYIDLMKVSTNDDLIYLIKNENYYVRYFAFIGLLDRKHPKIKELYNSIKNDSSTIYISNGACLRNWYPANLLMKDAMSNESKYSIVFKNNIYHDLVFK